MRKKRSSWGSILPFILGLAFAFVFNAGLLYAASGTDNPNLQDSTLQPPAAPSVSGETDNTETPPAASQKKSSKAPARAKSQDAAVKTPSSGAAGRSAIADGLGMPAAARKQYSGKPVSLDLMDADLRNVLRLLSDITGTNIVIEPDVIGKVTLKVEQVPWDQVLDMVLSMNDLGKEQLGNVIRIAKQSKLRQEYAQQAESIRAKQELAEATKDLGELSTVYLSVNFAKPTEVAAKISEAKSDRGKVSVDDRTSLVVYTDYPARVANARQLLSRLDRPTPQVLIEARIITLNSEVKKSLGVTFGISTQHSTTSSNVQSFAVNGPPLDIFDFNIAQLIGKTLLTVDLELSALEAASQLRIMAAPRVLTLDNVKATVTQGTQIPYLKVGDTAANVTATDFKDAVLELQVTPHVTPDRKVRMTIDLKQDEPSATLYVNNEPGIDTRKIATELLVDDGNIVVIGGVIRNTDSQTKNSTPGVSDIPIIGGLFKQESTDVVKNELLIFISPRIVELSKPLDRS
jgi:type IV pilus assembly protein PilQ